MKKAVLFILRYVVSFFLPTTVLIIRYDLYRSRSALYTVGIATVAIVGIAVCKWIAKSENNSIPRKWAYVPNMLRMPAFIGLALVAVFFAQNYADLLIEVLATYLVCCVASMPLTIAYNKHAWEEYRAQFGNN